MADATKLDFRDALLKAARTARQSGQITLGQYARIWLSSFDSKTVAKVQASVLHEAAAEGGYGDLSNVSAIDWAKLLAFIQTMLPLILQIIALFG